MKTDSLIIGCGIAGAAAALRLSENPNHHITVLTRAISADDSNTAWAQGGIVTRGLGDSPALLVNDIIQAGAGLSSRKAAQILATEGPKLVESVLINRCGVRFDAQDNGQVYFGLEAAHSVRRIVHVGDKTGYAIAVKLLNAMAECPNITLLTAHTALELLVDGKDCIGAMVYDKSNQTIEPIFAAHTIMATGGIGQLYQNTTNPVGTRGDGLAMAHRVGAQLANLEYIQFHPTALYCNNATHPLVSEAVRGEGARLLTPDGKRFMADYAPQKMELATRDVIARAIHNEMQTGDFDYVLLDIASQRSAEFIRERFPALIESTMNIGINPTVDMIPVVPAAHYFCGGIKVDEWAKTSVPNLYAIGEVSCTGLHGANRLASTSLLEGLVWGDRVARYVAHQTQNIRTIPVEKLTATEPIDNEIITQYWQRLRRTMWQNVGIVRTERNMQQAEQDLKQLALNMTHQFQQTPYNDAIQGLKNAVQSAQLITQSARLNMTSKGTHFRSDTHLMYANVSNH